MSFKHEDVILSVNLHGSHRIKDITSEKDSISYLTLGYGI